MIVPGDDQPLGRALVRDHRGRFSVVWRRNWAEANGVTLRPLYVGLCGTDLDIARGRRDDRAAVLGHEGVATVVEATSDAGLDEGDLVVFNPVNDRDQTDILGHSRDGLLQDRLSLTIDDVRRGAVLRVNPGLADQNYALVEPLGTVVYGQALVDEIVAPSTVVVAGAGPIGVLNAIYARLAGKTVLLADRSDSRLALAVQLGLATRDKVVLAWDRLWTEVLDRTDGKGADAAYICVPRSDTLNALAQALRYVRAGGCIDLVAGLDPATRLADGNDAAALYRIRWANSCGNSAVAAKHAMPGRFGPVWITGHRGTARRHLLSAMEHLTRFDSFGRVVTHVVSMEQAADILNGCLENPQELPLGGTALKVIVALRG